MISRPLFCFCLFLTLGQSTVVRQQHLICTSITSARCRRIIVFNFDCHVHLFVQMSCLFVREVFNNSTVLSETVVALKLRKKVLCVPQSAQIYISLLCSRKTYAIVKLFVVCLLPISTISS